MKSPEQLIRDYQYKVEKLEKKLEQAHQDIKDFELLAVEWKRGYTETERKLRIKLENAEQVIEELQEELHTLRNNDRWD